MLTLAMFAVLMAVATPAFSQTITCAGQTATLVGTEGRDSLVGTDGPDVIVALGGSDRIYGNGGDDIICAGSGRDRVWGGPGDDRIEGGPGRDRLVAQGGDDTVLGGSGRDVLKGGTGNDRLNGGKSTDTCLAGETLNNCEALVVSVSNPTVSRVLHISIDGLRPDHITQQLMPNLTAFLERSTHTMNARTDPAFTKTLPNHTSQLTGRPVFGGSGHGITYNEDMGRTVHTEAGEYVASVFDVVHDNGLRTAVYAGKSKFDMVDRTWNGQNGAVDTTGTNDGRDKLDFFLRDDPEDAVDPFVAELSRTSKLAYTFFHVRSPDEFGHSDTWGSAAYREGVAEADRVFGRLVNAIDGNPEWAASTAIIVVSDHGGPLGQSLHQDESLAENYTIPFIVWAPGVAAGTDLYALNSASRQEPGTSQIGLDAVQPIRGHDVANLALDLLGLPPVPGSVANVRQDLRINQG